MKKNEKPAGERLGIVVAVTNHKGGVAKTTTTLSVGYGLARRGFRVLLIDLDPQSNLTLSLFKNNSDNDYQTIYDSINKGMKNLPVMTGNLCIKQSPENLHLVPSSLNLAQLEISLTGILQREYVISEKLESYRGEYDFIFIDCPPNLGIFTVNALVAADYALIPMTPEVLPYQGLGSLITLVSQISKRMNTRLSVLGILLTRYKPKNNLTHNIENAVGMVYGPLLMKSTVRDTTKVAESPYERTPLFDYAPEATATKDYEDVVDEILERLGLEPKNRAEINS